MSVYGDFLENFQEAFRTIELLDGRKIRGIYISHGGDMVRLSYEKYESDGLMRDIVEQDELYVLRKTAEIIKEGTEFFHPDNGCVMRIVGNSDYNHLAGYSHLRCERVTGQTSLHTEKLPIKEAQFA